MSPTRPFAHTVNEQLKKKEFRRAFLGEALACVFTGDLETGKSVLRHYVNGTVGFVKLGEALGKSPKSLMRMLGPSGNPNLRSFVEIVVYLQKVDRTVLTVQGLAA
jgi:DNA-binding phage protein